MTWNGWSQVTNDVLEKKYSRAPTLHWMLDEQKQKWKSEKLKLKIKKLNICILYRCDSDLFDILQGSKKLNICILYRCGSDLFDILQGGQRLDATFGEI